MSEIKTNEVLEILDKMEMFQGQRAGRELWADKPTEVQEEDLANFTRDIGMIRKYIESQSNVLQRILDRLKDIVVQRVAWFGKKDEICIGVDKAIEIVEEEGGIE